jgi:hypothetical protein
MKKVFLTILFICSFIYPHPAESGTYSFEVFLGEQFNLPTPLTIKQEGEETIEIHSARYDSEAWTGLNSPYYAWRVGRWDKGRAWEIELVHEKIILKDPPEEVQDFEISHGYNLITINRAWRLPEYHDLIWRAGAGIVLTHPETTVRDEKRGYGESFPDGFYISGPTAQLALGKRINIWRGLFGVLEVKLTASYAMRVPIADGHAEVPNVAFHYLFGLGYEIGSGSD